MWSGVVPRGCRCYLNVAPYRTRAKLRMRLHVGLHLHAHSSGIKKSIGDSYVGPKLSIKQLGLAGIT